MFGNARQRDRSPRAIAYSLPKESQIDPHLSAQIKLIPVYYPLPSRSLKSIRKIMSSRLSTRSGWLAIHPHSVAVLSFFFFFFLPSAEAASALRLAFFAFFLCAASSALFSSPTGCTSGASPSLSRASVSASFPASGPTSACAYQRRRLGGWMVRKP